MGNYEKQIKLDLLGFSLKETPLLHKAQLSQIIQTPLNQ